MEAEIMRMELDEVKEELADVKEELQDAKDNINTLLDAFEEVCIKHDNDTFVKNFQSWRNDYQ